MRTIGTLALVALAPLFTSSARAQAAPPTPAKEAPPAARPAQQVAQSQAEAQRLSDAFVFVAEKVGPSVVQIDVTERDQRQDIGQDHLEDEPRAGDRDP